MRWKQVPGFPKYEVSSTGLVRRQGRLLKGESKNGYRAVTLSDSGCVTRSVHRVVLEAFEGPCPEGMQCRHLNDIRTDNRLRNLRWATPTENGADARANGGHRPRASNRLTPEAVRSIRKDGRHYGDIGATHGVSLETIYDVKKRRTWKWVTD